MKKMMGMMMMGAAMKMAAMIPLAIAGLFVLAGKALITAKVCKNFSLPGIILTLPCSFTLPFSILFAMLR